jgi:D-alanine-D-alanine ligase
MDKLNITVMLGGPSAEREISLRTGKAVANALRQSGHNVNELDPLPGQWMLPGDTDVVFLALHGSYGEDGTVQSELDALNVPYTGCNAQSSRIAFDKVLTKRKCLEQGVPTARYEVINSEATPFPKNFPLPAVLKPVRQGSSVGLHFIRGEEDWAAAVKAGLQFDTELLLEQQIIGRETTVGILAGNPLPIVEVRPKSGAYDYQNKYTAGATDYFCPADFPREVAERIQRAGLGAFNAIGGRDYARVDVMVTLENEPVVLEVNTLPGMTETSLLPKAAAAAGLNYQQLCQRMIGLALARANTTRTI